MPLVEGNIPLALSGGQSEASRKPDAPKTPLIKRTPAKKALAFLPHPKRAFAGKD